MKGPTRVGKVNLMCYSKEKLDEIKERFYAVKCSDDAVALTEFLNEYLSQGHQYVDHISCKNGNVIIFKN